MPVLIEYLIVSGTVWIVKTGEACKRYSNNSIPLNEMEDSVRKMMNITGAVI
jgi:hypothetical protein